MAVRQYIGARYVPIFSELNGGVWDNSYSYEPLTIVKYGNDFYTSRIPVPVGADILNDHYWVLTGNYNGAIAGLTARVEALEDEQLIFTPEQYGAKGDGVTDDTGAFQDAIDAAIAAGGMVIASRVYATTGSLKISNTVSLPATNEKPFMIFNKILYSGSDAALYLCGRDIRILGGAIMSAKHGISCGDGTKGLQNSYIDVSLLDAAETCIITKPSSSENIQYIYINNMTLYYGLHGIDFDLTTRHIGEIHLTNCAFARKGSSSIVAAAIYGHNFDHAITGLYLNDVSFEGVPDKNCLEFDGVKGGRPVFPLQLDHIRYEEASYGVGKLIKYTGTGSPLPAIYADINVDVINLDSLDISSISDAYVHVTAGKITGSNAHAAVYSPTLNKLLPIPNDYEAVAVSGVITKLPDNKIIRLTGDTTLDIAVDFIGEKLILAAGTTAVLTLHSSGGDITRTLTSNTMVRMYTCHLAGVGMRVLLTNPEPVNFYSA